MKLDALDHPKTMDFAARLGVELPTAIGHLELLWAFTGKKAPRGNIGRWPDGAIARACYWMGDPETFVAALRAARFLDADREHRLIVHDWRDHAPRWVLAKLAKSDESFITASPVEPTTETTTEPTVVASSKGREVKTREGKGERDVAQERDGSPVERIFEHWRQEHGHPKAQLDAKRRRTIRAALKNYSPDDLCLAISGYRNSPHHMGTDPRGNGVKYDSLELFLRDAEHVDAGLRFARAPPVPPKQETATERLLRNLNEPDRVIEHERDPRSLTHS